MASTLSEKLEAAFFGKLNPEFRDQLLSVTFEQNWPTNVVAICAGQKPTLLFTLVEGRALVFRQVGGRQMSMRVAQAPAVIQLANVLTRSPYSWSVKSLADTTVAVTPADALHSLTASEPSVAGVMIGELARSTQSSEADLFNQRFLRSPHRLARWILQQADELEHRNSFHLGCEMHVLASLLGMTPENLGRSFALLEKKGATCSGRLVVVTDRPRLKRFAEQGMSPGLG